MLKLVDFVTAIDAVQQGKMIKRDSWATSFIFMEVNRVIAPEKIPNLDALPPAVKDEFEKRGGHLKMVNRLMLVKQDNSILTFYFQPADFMAKDWIILD